MLGESNLLVKISYPAMGNKIQLMLDESSCDTVITTSSLSRVYKFGKRTLFTVLIKWLGQLCLAFAWRFEHPSIHYDYLRLIAGAPLTILAAFQVCTLHQKTSQQIISQFTPL